MSAEQGYGISAGIIFGSISFLHFGLIAHPGRWLFTRMTDGAAMLAYADIALAWIGLCAFVGYRIAKATTL